MVGIFAIRRSADAFTASAFTNPTAAMDPFTDWPGTGSVPNKPYTEIDYSQAQFDTIVATAAPGYIDVPL